MAPRVELRRLEDEDRERILAWRNSPDVRAYMYTDHVIAPQEHAAWFAGIEGDERRRYWIISSDDAPVGLANLYDIDRRNQRCAWPTTSPTPACAAWGWAPMSNTGCWNS